MYPLGQQEALRTLGLIKVALNRQTGARLIGALSGGVLGGAGGAAGGHLTDEEEETSGKWTGAALGALAGAGGGYGAVRGSQARMLKNLLKRVDPRMEHLGQKATRTNVLENRQAVRQHDLADDAIGWYMKNNPEAWRIQEKIHDLNIKKELLMKDLPRGALTPIHEIHDNRNLKKVVIETIREQSRAEGQYAKVLNEAYASPEVAKLHRLMVEATGNSRAASKLMHRLGVGDPSKAKRVSGRAEERLTAKAKDQWFPRASDAELDKVIRTSTSPPPDKIRSVLRDGPLSVPIG